VVSPSIGALGSARIKKVTLMPLKVYDIRSFRERCIILREQFESASWRVQLCEDFHDCKSRFESLASEFRQRIGVIGTFPHLVDCFPLLFELWAFSEKMGFLEGPIGIFRTAKDNGATKIWLSGNMPPPSLGVSINLAIATLSKTHPPQLHRFDGESFNLLLEHLSIWQLNVSRFEGMTDLFMHDCGPDPYEMQQWWRWTIAIHSYMIEGTEASGANDVSSISLPEAIYVGDPDPTVESAKNFLRQHPNSNAKQVANACNIVPSTFRRHIAPKLKNEGFTSTMGPMGGYSPPK
jgi:hypothetical protein